MFLRRMEQQEIYIVKGAHQNSLSDKNEKYRLEIERHMTITEGIVCDIIRRERIKAYFSDTTTEIHAWLRNWYIKKLCEDPRELEKSANIAEVKHLGDIARIRSKGDQALFGGLTTFQMKNKMKVPTSKPLADFLPTITITAKNLATEITNFNVKKDF